MATNDKLTYSQQISTHFIVACLIAELHGDIVGLRKTADDGEEFGHAANDFVCNNFYGDDGLSSCSNPAKAIDLVMNTQTMLATANLKLHKIASNTVEVMQALPPEDQIDSMQNLDLQQDPLPSQRSLGVMLNLQNDVLTFSISLPEKHITR